MSEANEALKESSQHAEKELLVAKQQATQLATEAEAYSLLQLTDPALANSMGKAAVLRLKLKEKRPSGAFGSQEEMPATPKSMKAEDWDAHNSILESLLQTPQTQQQASASQATSHAESAAAEITAAASSTETATGPVQLPALETVMTMDQAKEKFGEEVVTKLEAEHNKNNGDGNIVERAFAGEGSRYCKVYDQYKMRSTGGDVKKVWVHEARFSDEVPPAEWKGTKEDWAQLRKDSKKALNRARRVRRVHKKINQTLADKGLTWCEAEQSSGADETTKEELTEES